MSCKILGHIIFILIFIMIGCQGSVETNREGEPCFENFAERFQPISLDFGISIDSTFKECSRTFENEPDSVVRQGVYLILLKQYLYQLQQADMGFQLTKVNNKTALKIVNYYIKLNHLDSAKLYNGSHGGQGLYSHQVYEDVVKNQAMLRCSEVRKIVEAIELELTKASNQ